MGLMLSEKNPLHLPPRTNLENDTFVYWLQTLLVPETSVYDEY